MGCVLDTVKEGEEREMSAREMHIFHQHQVQELQKKIIEQARVIEVQSVVVSTVGQQFHDLKDKYVKEAFPKLFPELPSLSQCPLVALNLPCRSMEFFIDDYMVYLQRNFLVNSLFLNVMATPQYKTLTCRVWNEKGYVCLQVLKENGYGVSGYSGMTLCQYVADTGQQFCFSAENKSSLFQAFSSKQLMLWFQEEKPEVKKMFDDMQQRGLPAFNDFAAQDEPLEKEVAHEVNLANMLEVAMYRKLNYIGAPVKDSKGKTLAVLCLLHDYPSKSQNMWPGLSQIEDVSGSLGKLLERELKKTQSLAEVATQKISVGEEEDEEAKEGSNHLKIDSGEVALALADSSKRVSYAAAHQKLMDSVRTEEIPTRCSRVSSSLRHEK